MDLRVLGPVEIYREHKLALGGPQHRRIIAALALRSGEVVSVDQLVDIIWSGEEPPKQPERNLRTYVSRIRSAVGDGIAERLVTAPPGYVLNLERDELDALRFEDLVESAARSYDVGDPQSAIGQVDLAIGLWHGTPFAEFADEPWVRPEVVRLQEVRLSALELRAHASIDIGREAEAIPALEALIDEHPFRERPRSLYMTALAGAGRQPDALRAFQEFRAVLVDEIGVDPSDEIADLDRRIARGELLSAAARNVRGYEVHELIGSGAFADVHRGRQPSLGRDVAIKTVRAELANRPQFVRGFEAEAAIVARLEHPHIVPLYDFWREPDRAYLVMRWLTGGSMEASLDAGPWTVAQTARMVEQVGAALALAHRAGVVHRDVKSANILLDHEDNAYLSDFGIAVEAFGVENPAAALSEGSPAYAAPEQLRREDVGPPADIFGLGIAAYEALTGRLPFAESKDQAELLRRQLHDPVPAPSKARPELPTAVDAVVATATAKEPESRYQDVDDFVEAFLSALAESPSAPAIIHEAAQRVTLTRTTVDNPYKGLRSFGEADAATFFGRDRLLGELLDVLRRPGEPNNFLGVVGPSGSGKSSLVRAGLVPALREGRVEGSDTWFTTSMTPGPHPFESLETALLRVAVNPPASLLGQLREDRRGILRGVRRILPDDGAVALLVIDQFEELFTQCDDSEVRSRFLQGLTVAVSDPGSPLRVVITMRADFYDHPLRYEGFADLVKRRSVSVTPLAADELEQAIVAPAELAGVGFEPGLVAEIVADVASQPGSLPLMQYALTELFDARVGGTLLRESYHELGGLAGALGRRADVLYDDLDLDQRQALRRAFGRLVTLGEGQDDTRRRALRGELGAGAAVEDVITAFSDARLLTFDRDPLTREPTIEVAHEALIANWERARAWLDEDRHGLRIQRHLSDAANEWTRGGADDGDLYRGARLESALEYRSDHEDDLTADEREFLDLSEASEALEAARQKRRNQVVRRALVASSVLLVVALVAGLVAVLQWRRAEDRATAAVTAENEAETGRLKALEAEDQALVLAAELEGEVLRGRAVDIAATDPVLGTLLALEAHNRAGESAAAEIGSVAEALLADPDWVGSIQSNWIERIPGRSEVLTTEAGQISIRDATDLKVQQTIPLDGEQTGAPAVSPEGERVAVVLDAELVVVDLATGQIGDGAELPGGMRTGGWNYTWDAMGDHVIIPMGSPTRLVVLEVSGIDVTVLSEVAIDALRNDATIWVDHDPDRSVLAAGWAETAVLYSTAELATEGLVEVDRFDLERPNQVATALTFVNWGSDGVLYAATWADGFWQIAGGTATFRSFEGDSSGDWVQELSDGTLFIGDIAGGGTIRDAATLEVLKGPWASRGRLQLSATTVADGAELAIVSTPVGAGATSIELRSVVGGNALTDTVLVPGLDASADAAPFIIEEADVAGTFQNRSPIVRISTGQPVDFGIPDLQEAEPALTADGWVGLVVSRDGRFTVHDLTSGERLSEPIEVDPLPLSVFLTHDGETAVFWYRLGLEAWDIASGTLVASIEHGGDFTNWLSLQPDAGIGLLSSTAGAVVFDAGSFEVLGSDLDLGIGSRLTADGERYVTWQDTSFVIGQWRTGAIDWVAPNPSGLYPAFSASGDHIIGAGAAGIQWWDIASSTPLGPLVPGEMSIAGFGPGLTWQFTDGAFHLWNSDPAAWPDRACEAVGRNLTAQEWEQFVPGDQPLRATCEQYPIGS